MSLNFRWFLALSVAAHAAVLLASAVPQPEAGNPGRVLLLKIGNSPSELASLPASNPGTGQHRPGSIAKQLASSGKPVFTAPPAISERTIVTNTGTAESLPPVASVTENIVPKDTANMAASIPVHGQEESNQRLRNSVMQLISQRLSYPIIARRKGWQGVVTLELHIEANGQVSALQVSKTSGYPSLDRAAMKSLQLVNIPGIRQWLHGRSIDMLVPVEYRLLDS